MTPHRRQLVRRHLQTHGPVVACCVHGPEQFCKGEVPRTGKEMAPLGDMVAHMDVLQPARFMIGKKRVSHLMLECGDVCRVKGEVKVSFHAELYHIIKIVEEVRPSFYLPLCEGHVLQ